MQSAMTLDEHSRIEAFGKTLQLTERIQFPQGTLIVAGGIQIECKEAEAARIVGELFKLFPAVAQMFAPAPVDLSERLESEEGQILAAVRGGE